MIVLICQELTNKLSDKFDSVAKSLNEKLDQKLEKFAVELNQLKKDVKNIHIRAEKSDMQMGPINLLLMALKEKVLFENQGLARKCEKKYYEIIITLFTKWMKDSLGFPREIDKIYRVNSTCNQKATAKKCFDLICKKIY